MPKMPQLNDFNASKIQKNLASPLNSLTVTKEDNSNSMKILKSMRWQQEEYDKLLQAYEKYGENWPLISKLVGTRSTNQ